MTKPAVGSTSRDSLWPTLREEVRDSRHSSWDWWLWVWVRGVDQALEDKLLATWLHLCHVFQSQCCVDTATGALAARRWLHHCRHLDHDWLLHYLNVHNGLVYRHKLLLDAHQQNVLEVDGELLFLLYNNGLLVYHFPSSPSSPWRILPLYITGPAFRVRNTMGSSVTRRGEDGEKTRKNAWQYNHNIRACLSILYICKSVPAPPDPIVFLKLQNTLVLHLACLSMVFSTHTVSWVCMQFLSLSEQLTRISQCLFLWG